MRRDNVVWETEPGSPFFDCSAVVKHLKRSVDMFVRPQGLIKYWNQPKNQQRRKLLSEAQYREVEEAFQKKLQELNDAGPY